MPKAIRNPQSAIRSPFTALLLAGGRSRRMGRDKAVLIVDGLPLWQRQLATLRALEPAELLISGPLDGPWRGAGIDIIPDDHPGLGPLGGLAAVLPRMQCERLLVLAIDLPAMTSDFLRALLTRCPAALGIVPQIGDRFEPLAAVYPGAMRLLAASLLAEDDRSMQRFVRAGLGQGLLVVHPVEPAECPLFRNVNEPDDLRK